jgi:hypothetical protein
MWSRGATAFMFLVCPSKRITSSPCFTSKTRTELSIGKSESAREPEPLAESKRRPSGEIALVLLEMLDLFPVATSQMEIERPMQPA